MTNRNYDSGQCQSPVVTPENTGRFFLKAVNQVATTCITFGNEYSSGELVFPATSL